ncbi:MAG: hypothetical protein RR710_00470 [Oscillospiraceae bacterium]
MKQLGAFCYLAPPFPVCRGIDGEVISLVFALVEDKIMAVSLQNDTAIYFLLAWEQK